MSMIYKILTTTQWAQFEAERVFKGAPVDMADGFIHFSTDKQVGVTAAKHFANQAGLMLVAVDGSSLGDALNYEPSRGGDLFPHLYADLTMEAVVWAKPLPLDDNGTHIFPDEVTA